ncbi:MAG: nicotinate (nicotinamide) nucleotide adenylyltransferase [Phycisphaeraceae bacterium]
MIRDRPIVTASCELPLERHGRLLLFGGSFDPPTRAHIELPERVREAMGFDAVLYVPAKVSPFKTQAAPPAPAADRVAMLKAGLAGREHAIILLDEVEVPGDEPSYTIDTVRELRQRMRDDAELRLLLGADQAASFHQWKASDELTELAEPVVMLRPLATAESVLASVPESERAAWARRLVEVPRMEVSATEVRQRLARGEAINDLVPDAVVEYIREHGLYQNGDGSPHSSRS